MTQKNKDGDTEWNVGNNGQRSDAEQKSAMTDYDNSVDHLAK